LHANWSLNSNTLKDYCYHPSEQYQWRNLVQQLFSDHTEMKITSRIGMKRATIVSWTTDNNTVGEKKRQRMWWRSALDVTVGSSISICSSPLPKHFICVSSFGVKRKILTYESLDSLKIIRSSLWVIFGKSSRSASIAWGGS
jgi:hypothetical protein